MSKAFKKYTRKIHRWLTVPFVIIMIISLANKGTPTGITAQHWQQWSILAMVLTGVYLLVLPWWAKWRRNAKMKRH